jgi:hypothetical protein
MIFHHDAGRLHRDDLDREIETIRIARQLNPSRPGKGLLDRARRRTGSALIAAGRAVGGFETRPATRFGA